MPGPAHGFDLGLVSRPLFNEIGARNPLLKQSNRGGVSYAFFERLRGEHETLAGVCNFLGRDRINVAVDGQAEVAYAQQIYRPGERLECRLLSGLPTSPITSRRHHSRGIRLFLYRWRASPVNFPVKLIPVMG
jgi:hypothetical protein